MTTKYYIDSNNNYLGGWDNNPPSNSVEVPSPPDDARSKWIDDKWSAPIIPYAEARVKQYPTIGDQLDSLYHAGIFPADMAAKIKAVKDKCPKN